MKLLNRFLSIVFIVFLPLLLALVATPLYATQTDISPPTQIQSFDDLPQGLAYAISNAFQDKLPSTYSLNRAQSGFLAKNPAHNMHFTFTDKGPSLSNKDNARYWSMTLTRWGRAKSLKKAPLAILTAKGPRMEYKRGASLSEWYMNTPWGLEQGFTVNNRPSTPKDIPSSLILELTLSGTLQPALQGNTLFLSDSTGRTCIRYTGLYAFDKEGKTLASRLALKGDTLHIIIDDTAASYPITIDPWVQQFKLVDSDGAPGDKFGYSVAIDGDTVVVGVPDDDFGGNTYQGSAYVFERSGNNWAQIAELTTNDGDYDFGCSVAISGDKVVVGAYNYSRNRSGAAYVFKKPDGGWVTTSDYDARFTASDGEAGDKFGYSVAISGNTVVVGAWGWANESAYVFSCKYVSPDVCFWFETAKLTASDGEVDNKFGHSVAINRDAVVVGAYCQNVDGRTYQGVVYVFEKPPVGGWTTTTETSRLTALDGDSTDWFGHSVAISGDTLVVGAPGCMNNGVRSGSAYVFHYGYILIPPAHWYQTNKITISDGVKDGRFGDSVAISGDTVAVGASQDTIGNQFEQGSAYVFKIIQDWWTYTVNQTGKLTASEGVKFDKFGHSVAISGDRVVAGAYGDSRVSDINPGSAYIFELKHDDSTFYIIRLKNGNVVVVTF